MRLFGNPHAERMGRLRLLEVNELRMLSNSDDADKFDIVSSVEVESHRHRSPTWDGYGLRECVVCVRNRERESEARARCDQEDAEGEHFFPYSTFNMNISVDRECEFCESRYHSSFLFTRSHG